MKNIRKKMENKGFTLVEIIVCLAIMTIVAGSVGAFIVAGNNSYLRGNKELTLQEEAQLAANQMIDLIIDVEKDIKFTNTTGTAVDLDGNPAKDDAGNEVQAQVGATHDVQNVAANRLGGQVLRMDVIVDANASVAGPVPVAHKGLHLGADGIFRIGLLLEGNESLAHVGLHAGLEHRTGTLLGRVVHVRKTDHAEARHLGAGEHRAPIAILGGHFGLEGEALLLEPTLQRQVLGVTAQKRHGSMGMGVVERGHEQTSRAIVGLAEGGSHIGRRRHRADIGDSAVAHPHPLVVLDSEVGVEKIDIGKEHGRPFEESRTGF